MAVISSSGLDFAGALAYGREKGGPALRALSFHERALMLKSIALMLNGERDAFYAESYRTGATKTDSMIDIDGGIGTGTAGRMAEAGATLMVAGSAIFGSDDPAQAYADIHAAVAEMRAKGVTILGTGEPRIGAHGTPVVFLHPRDMGGVLIELMETPKAGH